MLLKRLRSQPPYDFHNAGYSLVELAIVLVVIGIIVGGVLKGRELIESARLKSVLSQLNEYRLATATFIDRYDALPGNFANASAYIDSALENGSGNGAISRTEASHYWSHLAAAGLIPKPGEAVGGRFSFGHGLPSTRIGGGITVVYSPFDDMPGHWYLLGGQNGDQNNGALLTPLQAMTLDNKADNGDPQSGRIRARNGWGGEGGDCIDAQGRYNTRNKGKACVLYFQF